MNKSGNRTYEQSSLSVETLLPRVSRSHLFWAPSLEYEGDILSPVDVVLRQRRLLNQRSFKSQGQFQQETQMSSFCNKRMLVVLCVLLFTVEPSQASRSQDKDRSVDRIPSQMNLHVSRELKVVPVLKAWRGPTFKELNSRRIDSLRLNDKMREIKERYAVLRAEMKKSGTLHERDPDKTQRILSSKNIALEHRLQETRIEWSYVSNRLLALSANDPIAYEKSPLHAESAARRLDVERASREMREAL